MSDVSDLGSLIAKADAGDPGAIDQLLIFAHRGDDDAIRWVEKKATDETDSDVAYYQYVAGKIYRCNDFARMDYKKAFDFFEAASKTSPLPLYELGRMYRDGAGTTQDYVKAFHCFKKAALQIPDAQFCLAEMYREGWGVEQNSENALSLYTKAAESGHHLAQFNIGLIKFALEKYTEAVVWWTKSAEQGCHQSQCNLGHLYEMGLGVERDKNKAMALWRQAALQGCPRSNQNFHAHNKLFFEDSFKTMVLHAKAFATLFF